MKSTANLIVAILFAFILSHSVLAQEKKSKEEIIKAIKETSTAITDYILDENGKSKCDYNIVSNKWVDYEPAWHTGQIIYGLTEVYKITNDSKVLQSAKKAGDWWTKLLIVDNPKLKGMLRAIHMSGIDNIIFATVTDGSAGLFRLSNLTNNKKYADVATSAGAWMLSNMYIEDKGLFYDAVNKETGEVMKEWSPFWPDKEKQQLNDVARPNNEGSIFLDMYKHTKNEMYKKVFIDLCNSLVEKQDEHGLWMDFTPNDKRDGKIHPRFNLWYAESLLDGYELTNDKKYLDAAIKTINMHKKLMQKDGTFFYNNYVDGKYNDREITGSTTAFLGILWIRLSKLGFAEAYKEDIELAKNWILKNRYSQTHPDKNLRGSLIDTKVRRKKGAVEIYQRDVGTSFGLRFLCDYYNFSFGKN